MKSVAFLVFLVSGCVAVHELLVWQAFIVFQFALGLEGFIGLFKYVHLVIRVVGIFQSMLMSIEVEIKLVFHH